MPPANLSEPAPPDMPVVDLEHERRKAKRAAEQKRRSELMCKEYRQYFNHAVTHGWNMDRLISLKDWFTVSDSYRTMILEKQAAGHYDPPQEVNRNND